MENHVTIEKFQRILKRFLSENYKVKNDAYLELLISHLSKNESAQFLQNSNLEEWVEQCLKLLEEDFNKINPSVTALCLKICALLTGHEWLVIQIREHEVAERIQKIVESVEGNLPASIKLGHVRFLAAVSKHSLGLRWIKKAEAWKSLIQYCQKNETVYVVREAMEVLYNILYKYSVKVNDRSLCVEILHEIVKPLLENVFQENTVTVCVDDSELQRKLSPTLDLIAYILQKTIESDSKSSLVNIMAIEFNIDINLWKLADMTQNQQFLGKILRAQISFNFATLIYDKWSDGQIAVEDFNQFGVNFFNYMKFCAARRSCSNMISMAELNHILWKKLKDRVPEEILIENERIQFENQLITFQLMPLLFILKSEDSPLFDNYILKLFTISCKFILQICYTFRDVLIENPSMASDLAYKSINGILSMNNSLGQDRAVLVSQALIYTLKMFTSDEEDINSRNKSTDLLMKIPNVLFAVLVGLQSLIQRYRIKWRDSIETICLLNFLLELLKDPNLSTRLAVQAMKLTQLSIEHFLSPNLALLVDNFNGSGMQNLGPMIMKRLHDTEWEVRDSTLELVASVASISKLKFPAFQQYLLDQGICPVVFSMARNDMEPYVRASAFKCLSEMSTLNLLWDKCLCNMDLMDHLLVSLCMESEGIVRKEAVDLVTKIYYHREIASEHLDCMYSTLSYSAVYDLHWEVKIRALHFWKVVVCRQFTNEGMIDGTFPTVTFSKENKKIVTLTEKEILLRIKKILNKLSQRGCLGVMLECLNDDCDLEVAKTAVLLVKKLFDNLKKYEYLQALDNSYENNEGYSNHIPSSEPTLLESNVSTSANGVELNAEQIIESIVTAQDINLLAQTYQNQMRMDTEPEQKKIDSNLYEKFAKVQPSEFISKVSKMNLDLLIEQRNNWIQSTESFDSLLDDMLLSSRALEVNDADCY